jgi:hypothetical protein
VQVRDRRSLVVLHIEQVVVAHFIEHIVAGYVVGNDVVDILDDPLPRISKRNRPN